MNQFELNNDIQYIKEFLIVLSKNYLYLKTMLSNLFIIFHANNNNYYEKKS